MQTDRLSGRPYSSSPASQPAQPASLCSVLVPSWDAYADLWPPFFTLFWRYWPDCPFPVYLGCKQLAFDHPQVKQLFSDRGSNWSSCLWGYLQRLDTPYVLLLLEDFFIRRPVNSQLMLEGLRAMQALSAHMLRLTPRPQPDYQIREYPFLGRVQTGVRYCVNAQATIWRRDSLLSLVREGESIWQFEIQGSQRSADMGPAFYCMWKTPLDYGHHVVEKGKWFHGAARQFERMDIGCDFSRRPILTASEDLWLAIQRDSAGLIYRLPWRQRLQVTALLNWLLRRKSVEKVKREL